MKPLFILFLILSFTMSSAQAIDLDHKGFILYVKGNKNSRKFSITGQITAINKNNKPYPLKNAPLYLFGPRRGERQNTVYQWFKTDNFGRYNVKVAIPGSYKIFLDPGWAHNHNIKSLSIRGGQVLVDKNLKPHQDQVTAAKTRGYIIREKVAFINSQNEEVPLEGVVIYIKGPLPLSPTTPNTMLAVKTDALGYYVAKVKYPGSYEVSLDIPSAQHKGVHHWTPNSYRILVK